MNERGDRSGRAPASPYRWVEPTGSLPDRDRSLARIRRAAAWVGLRLRLGKALASFPPALLAALGLMAATLAVHRALPDLLSAQVATAIVMALPALVPAAVLVTCARASNPPLAGAVALERHHGLRGRLSAALAFAASAPRRRTAWMGLAIDDACAHADPLAPGKASPLRAPRGLLLAGGIALATVATARLQSGPPTPATEPPSPVERASAVTLHGDRLAVLEGFVGCWDDRQLVEDLGAGRLDRAALLRKIASEERSLERSGPFTGEERRARREGLADLRSLIRLPVDAARAARTAVFDRRAEGGTGEDRRATDGPGAASPGVTPDARAVGHPGELRREAILTAADRGFKGAGYHDAFVQYRTVAQEHLEQDRIPDGQRFYVRRYFALIRPRE